MCVCQFHHRAAAKIWQIRFHTALATTTFDNFMNSNLTVTFMIFSINSDPTSIYHIYDLDLPFAMICSKVCGWSHLQVRTCTREGACHTCLFWFVLNLLLSEQEIMTQVSISFSLCKSERHSNSIFGILFLIEEIL